MDAISYHHKVVGNANIRSVEKELTSVSVLIFRWFFLTENDLFPLMAPAAVLVGRLAACGGRWASYSVSRQLARINGIVRGKPPPLRPQSSSNPVAATVVRFGGKGWDFILYLSCRKIHLFFLTTIKTLNFSQLASRNSNPMSKQRWCCARRLWCRPRR